MNRYATVHKEVKWCSKANCLDPVYRQRAEICEYHLIDLAKYNYEAFHKICGEISVKNSLDRGL